MRRFIRHPSTIAIELAACEPGEIVEKPLLVNAKDISFGGICCETPMAFAPDQWVQVVIPFVEPRFEVVAKVVWCRPEASDSHMVGIAFASSADAFAARMVEQICHIEHYRREVLELEGRALTDEMAAKEWITQYADSFPYTESP